MSSVHALLNTANSAATKIESNAASENTTPSKQQLHADKTATPLSAPVSETCSPKSGSFALPPAATVSTFSPASPSSTTTGSPPCSSSSTSSSSSPSTQPNKSNIVDRNNEDLTHKPILCQWGNSCNLLFPDAETLYRHLCQDHVGRKSHKNLQLQCQWGNCKVETTKRDHITSHLRVHVPSKPFSCSNCHKKFKRSQDLKKHLKVHFKDTLGNGGITKKNKMGSKNTTNMIHDNLNNIMGSTSNNNNNHNHSHHHHHHHHHHHPNSTLVTPTVNSMFLGNSLHRQARNVVILPPLGNPMAAVNNNVNGNHMPLNMNMGLSGFKTSTRSGSSEGNSSQSGNSPLHSNYKNTITNSHATAATTATTATTTNSPPFIPNVSPSLPALKRVSHFFNSLANDAVLGANNNTSLGYPPLPPAHNTIANNNNNTTTTSNSAILNKSGASSSTSSPPAHFHQGHLAMPTSIINHQKYTPQLPLPGLGSVGSQNGALSTASSATPTLLAQPGTSYPTLPVSNYATLPPLRTPQSTAFATTGYAQSLPFENSASTSLNHSRAAVPQQYSQYSAYGANNSVQSSDAILLAHQQNNASSYGIFQRSTAPDESLSNSSELSDSMAALDISNESTSEKETKVTVDEIRDVLLYIVEELGLSSDNDASEKDQKNPYFSEAPLELDVETFQAIKDYVMCTYRELSGESELDSDEESGFPTAGPAALNTAQTNTFIEMKYPTISV
ncbi:hypothetical protein ACO0QE_003143 [Hanseniaspora vineae]